MAWKCRVILLLALLICLNLLVPSDGRKLQSQISPVRKLEESTNPGDVQGLTAIVQAFTILGPTTDDRDDPCLPVPLSWIGCSKDNSPRVTALYLGGLPLSGEIPDFRTMDALQTIDMHNSYLRGPIPSFLGTLPNLKQLNLANNLLSGYVPISILQNKKLKTDFSGNPTLFPLSPTPFGTGGSSPGFVGGGTTPTPTPGGQRTETPDLGSRTTETPDLDSRTTKTETPFTNTYKRPKSKKKSNLGAIIGGSVSAFALLWSATGGITVFRQRAKSKAAAAVAQPDAGSNMAAETTEEAPMNAARSPS